MAAVQVGAGRGCASSHNRNERTRGPSLLPVVQFSVQESEIRFCSERALCSLGKLFHALFTDGLLSFGQGHDPFESGRHPLTGRGIGDSQGL